MRWTVSVKGVLIDRNQVLLGLNDRNEWELPGGQLEEGEGPRAAVAREIAEETGVAVTVGGLLLADVLEVLPGREVLIIAFRCSVSTSARPEVRCSAEHQSVEWIPVPEIADLALPAIYRRAITEALGTNH